MIVELAQASDLRQQFGQTEVDDLVVDERPPGTPAARAVVDSQADGSSPCPLCSSALPPAVPLWNCFICRMKPSPLRRCGWLGHAHVLEGPNMAVSLAWLPSFSSLRLTLKPGVAVGTMMSDMPRNPRSSPVRSQQGDEVGLRAVGDPHLGPVDDVVVTVNTARVRMA